MAYKPMTPFAVPLVLLIPTKTESNYGVSAKTFPAVKDGIPFFGSFRTFGGTETTADGVYSVEDTATIETWFRPDITAACRVALADDPTAIYEVEGTPEDIERRHQYLHIRVRRVKGGA